MTQQDIPAGASATTGTPLPAATSIKQLLIEPVSPADNGAIIAQAILNAQQSVWMEVYLVTHSQVLQALTQAAALDPVTGQKKDIRVILEPNAYPFSATPPTGQSPSPQSGSHHMPSYDQVTQQLSAAGVLVQQNKTPLYYRGETHSKLMIIDKQTAYIMTANLTTDSLGYEMWSKPQPANNREYIVIDEDPARVQSLIALFTADWDASAPRFYTTQLQSSALVVSPSQPDASQQIQGNARDVLLQLIAGAQHTIQIEMEEIHENDLSRSTIEQALVSAAQRNVSVQILLPANATSSRGLATTSDDVNFLTSGQVQVQLATTPNMHAKMILVDAQAANGQVVSGNAFIGSQNLTTAAFDHNREVGLLISDANALTTLWQTFQQDWNNSQPVS